MNNDIHLLLRSRRQILGVDQKTLAQVAGVSVHALSDLESGKGNPTLSTLQRVLEALGLTLQVRVQEMDHA
jgi:predicted transcriptional regulator